MKSGNVKMRHFWAYFSAEISKDDFVMKKAKCHLNAFYDFENKYVFQRRNFLSGAPFRKHAI